MMMGDQRIKLLKGILGVRMALSPPIALAEIYLQPFGPSPKVGLPATLLIK